MTAEDIARLMESAATDGRDRRELRKARILLRLREQVAQATERAGRDLMALGYSLDDVDAIILGRRRVQS